MLVHFKVYEEGGTCVTMLGQVTQQVMNGGKVHLTLLDEKNKTRKDLTKEDIVGPFHGFVDVPKI